MIIKTAEFIKSSTKHTDCPKAPFPEYAFIGRSNVGKSSLINMLAGHKGLAKISSTPGKTQLLNHFLINSSWYLCDLPGYGFAKVSKSIRDKWDGIIKNYLLHRPNLVNTFLLIDIRHEALKNDLDFLNWLGAHGLPVSLVFTKSDKLSKTKIQQQLAAYKRKLAESWDPLPPYIVSSSKTGEGKEEILKSIAKWNKNYSHNFSL